MQKLTPFLIFIFLLGCSAPLTSQPGLPTPVGTLVSTEIPTAEPIATSIPPTPEPFVRDTVYLESSELHTQEDQPGIMFLRVTGQLPTPCHQASAVVCPSCSANNKNLIQVNLYALIENGRTCKGPTTPFEQDIPLGLFTEGVHVVLLNGQYVGEFDAASIGKEVSMEKATVFLEGITIMTPEGYNEQAKLNIQGYLPTPCHVFKADVAPANEKGEIFVEAYSLVPLGEACIDVIQDFTSEVPLGALASGMYSIWVNGEEIGILTVP